jgi:DNA-binding MarR family transcriptional regulator
MSTKPSNPASVTAQFLEALTKESNEPTLGVQQVLLLLSLYNYGQLGQHDLERHTGVKRSSNSRNIAKMGAGEKPWSKTGPGWVESYEDPMDRRNKMVRLTPQGSALIRSAIEQVK